MKEHFANYCSFHLNPKQLTLHKRFGEKAKSSSSSKKKKKKSFDIASLIFFDERNPTCVNFVDPETSSDENEEKKEETKVCTPDTINCIPCECKCMFQYMLVFLTNNLSIVEVAVKNSSFGKQIFYTKDKFGLVIPEAHQKFVEIEAQKKHRFIQLIPDMLDKILNPMAYSKNSGGKKQKFSM